MTPTTQTTTPTLLAKSPAQLTGKPMTAPAPTAASTAFVQKAKPVTARTPRTLADTNADYVKILLFGATGTGKTKAIADLLELGHTILAVSCDIGGEGFTSVRQWLKKRGKEELLKNCFYFELPTYQDVEDFCSNPKGFWPDIYNHDIDTLVLDGYSTFQICHVQDMALEMDGGRNSVEARTAGLRAETTDWGVIKNASVKNLNKFLLLRNETTGKTWHKLITCLEQEKEVTKGSDAKIIAPMLQGAAAKLLEPCFDLIMRTSKAVKTGEGGKKEVQYFYELDGTSNKIVTKSRGLEFEPKEPGDMTKIFTSICTQRGIPVGKR